MEIYQDSVCYVVYLECMKDNHVKRAYFYYNDTSDESKNLSCQADAVSDMNSLLGEFDYFHIFVAGISPKGSVVETKEHEFYNGKCEECPPSVVERYLSKGNPCDS